MELNTSYKVRIWSSW